MHTEKYKALKSVFQVFLNVQSRLKYISDKLTKIQQYTNLEDLNRDQRVLKNKEEEFNVIKKELETIITRVVGSSIKIEGNKATDIMKLLLGDVLDVEKCENGLGGRKVGLRYDINVTKEFLGKFKTEYLESLGITKPAEKKNDNYSK